MAAQDTVGELLARGAGRLSSRLDTELLLAHALGLSRVQLKTHPERMVDPQAAALFQTLLERRSAGEPVAYIVGYRDFWSLRLMVDARVLIPRPETELIVERALALVLEPAAAVADLGTGSGAIPLALASERQGWAITATDVSTAALEVARTNAQTLGARIELVQGCWFEPLQGRRFNLVTSNPPYIAAGDPALFDANVRHEPSLALTAGPDGLAALRSIIDSAPGHLERHGWLVLEHGMDQARAVADTLVGRGFAHVRSHRDLAGHERVTEGQWR
jgi:release factor glutamine methyltransferase